MEARERVLRGLTRRAQRLRNWDYRSPGVYFVTFVTWDRGALFGEVDGATMTASAAGEIVEAEWRRTPELRPNVEIDEFVVMPNHFHGVVRITTEVPRGGQQPARTDQIHVADSLNQSLSSIVRGFKATTARQVNQLRATPGAPVWHRSFHDSIVRDERHLEAVRRYIRNNPKNWPNDPNHR